MSKVILSKKTLDVLKNFSTINSSIVFRKGSTVRTISNAENILAKFTGEDVFSIADSSDGGTFTEYNRRIDRGEVLEDI